MNNSDYDQKNVGKSENLPTNYETYLTDNRLSCAVEIVFRVIGGRWKVLIFRELLLGEKRFNQLHRSIHGISHKILTEQLREMEKSGIVHRQVYDSVMKVEYSLTSWGKSLHPVINVLHQWGIEYLEHYSNRENEDF